MSKLLTFTAILIVMSVFYTQYVSGIIDKAINAGNKAFQEVGDKAIEQGFKAFCAATGDGVKAMQTFGMGFLKCDKAHAKEAHCKIADNAPMIHSALCGMAEDKARTFFKHGVNCFKMPDPHGKGQDCIKNWIEEMKDCAELASTFKDQMG
ncbi:uncharacterized protein LOC128959405 [Oppia nitens]|uniref:uncharacterized protein LOC128959405 n=1 Tax=Oppia nitens TaxID=1686743 RepID=UPI0023DBA93C|nr:uncharacterized protein LOC128959405 [Oppia nitens]